MINNQMDEDNKVIRLIKIQFILKSLVIILIATLVLELASTGASPNVQNNASFSGVVLSVGRQKALFSGDSHSRDKSWDWPFQLSDPSCLI